MRTRFLTPIILTILTVPSVVFAQGYGFRNPLGVTSLPEVIGRIVGWAGGIAGSLFFFFLIWGGIEWMTAGGNESKVKSAQGRIVSSLTGIVVVLLAYLAVATIIGLVPGRL